MIHTLILTGVLLHIGDGAWIDKLNIGVKSGFPGIIPCQYVEQYQENLKYWCQGMFWSSCTILAFGNGPRSKFSITDYPAQSIFTVEWQNLQPSDSGYYWCAVEIGDSEKPDASYYLYLKVQSAPDVSVKSSSVSGHEGGNVSVQCFYSSGYKAKNKQWCGYKDKKCFYPKKNTGTSQNSSVQISDDGKSSFTVLMAGLRLSDSGWYFCSVGDLQVPVRLTVTKPEPKDPDLSVMNSSVSGHVGGNVSVQCFYSSGYKNKTKQWCRVKDESCFPENKTDTSQNSSVQISDDGESSFIVLMTGLSLSDSGWYFCSVGNLQVPVQLTVSKPDPKDLYTTQPSAKQIPTTVLTTVSRPGTNILNKEHFCLSET
ncbi:polymeric immunoglobulin receptor-like 3.10 precursor [Danio rerio]|nr:polymeric immunoglobulin receptor-like 3.10 precursor [Danio rerio]AHH83823.1 polymeric immunoglobulin receptor-like group 3-10 transcript variant 3 [Danio rerio]